ncbi:deoxyribodipyrimidine photo-lyase [soil metagenome]
MIQDITEFARVTTKAAASDNPVILWFRRDLRLADNPALNHAAETGRPVIPVFILDDAGDGRPWGAASKWWLDRSLRALADSLSERGAPLILRRGDSEAVLHDLIDRTGADTIFMNRLFEPEAWSRDADIAHALKAIDVECRGFNGSLMCTPGKILNGSGGPYKVFTPFLKTLLATAEAPGHTPGPRDLSGAPKLDGDDIDGWGLRPTRPDWSKGFDWTPGEAGAVETLNAFTARALKSYSLGRDHPAEVGGSRLSPHLHWGEIHPWRVVEAARKAADDGRAPRAEADKFIAEIGWREFSAHLLHHFPRMPERSFRPEYETFPWRDDDAGFAAWTRGLTGYPIVDAGLRQLWTTGWMHNRVRMIVASFLIKDLLIDWRRGEAWFWDTLVDADLASNVQNWQWVAGSGADASPFFRIFNPTTQGTKFDPAGKYVRQWVPELRGLPDKWIHAPWTAPPEVLRDAKIRLGHDYPKPVVDHAEARDRALAALKAVANSKYDD